MSFYSLFKLIAVFTVTTFPIIPVHGIPEFWCCSAGIVGCCSRGINRHGEPYSTLSNRGDLITIGATFEISPRDSFDVVPPSGGGNVEVFEDLSDTYHAAIVRGSIEDAHEWAVAAYYHHMDGRLPTDSDTLTKREVPMPIEKLPGKALTVTDDIITKEVDAGVLVVLCHLIEDGIYFCHKTEGRVDVTSILVSPTPNGKKSILWVACHYVVDSDDVCHVMNAKDVVFMNDDFDILLDEKQDEFAEKRYVRGKE